MTNALVIGGFACSGKSTAVEELEKRGFYSYSTSSVLHKTTLFFLETITGRLDYKIEKNLTYDFDVELPLDSTSKTLTGRDLLIKVAENVLVPVFGRKLFSRTVVEKLLEQNPENAVLETIGGEEWILMRQYLEENNINYLPVNIRRETENPSADCRKLLPGAIDVHNDGTEEDLVTKLLNLVVGELKSKETD